MALLNDLNKIPAIKVPPNEQILRTKITNLENVIKAQDQCIQAYRDLVEILKKGTQP